MDEQLNIPGQAVADAEAKARYDARAKDLPANTPILAWILKYTTTEFAKLTPDEIISYIDNDPMVSSVSVVPGSKLRNP